MTAFFIKTEQAASGPFTGIELREAALAGIIGTQSIVGGSPTGPWIRASEIGLFSEKGIALPHPPGTPIPNYQVRGMVGAAAGPFKLRELIGFAARGMLPSDARLQSNLSPEWFLVDRIRILDACLEGELVLLGAEGKLLRRTQRAGASAAHAEVVEPSTHVEEGIAPSSLAKSVDLDDMSTYVQPIIAEDEIEEDSDVVPVSCDRSGSEFEFDEEETNETRRRRWLPSLGLRLPGVSIARASVAFLARPRIAFGLSCCLLVMLGVGSAYSTYRPPGMPRGEIIGQWMFQSVSNPANHSQSESNQTESFGVAFHEDGSCVLFNTQSSSWTGDFRWTDRTDDESGLTSLHTFEAKINEIAPDHQQENVQLSDGHLRFVGMAYQTPRLAGREVEDCFVRRQGDRLSVGYLASVNWLGDRKQLKGGWVVVTPISRRKAAIEVYSTLKSIPTEQRPLDIPSASEPILHLAEAIEAITALDQDSTKRFALKSGRLTFSSEVTKAWMLRELGIPDEARPALPFEIPKLQTGPSFKKSEMVRYHDLRFLFSSNGRLLYVYRTPAFNRGA